MAKGIVAKIWNISVGSGSRTAAAQISSSIEYIENPEKVGVVLDIDNANLLTNQLTYVTNDVKTMDGLYVGGRHIVDFDNATNEMMQVKEFYGKLGGRVATHGIISLDREESDPKNAGKLMLLLNDFMAELFPEHQVVYAVHTNTENLHIHFVINTVGLDGKKIHMDRSFMKKIFEPTLNKLAERYEFTPNEKWRRDVVVDKVPIAKRKILLRKLIDHAIEQTDDIESFIAYLRADGLEVNVGKHISVEMDDMTRPMRTNQLGENYTPQAIVRRLATKQDPLIWNSVGEHSHYLSKRELVNFTPTKMKKYKDMSKEEKQKALRLIRLGRNPWEERYIDNWQIQKMARELNETAYVYELVHFYSGGKDNTDIAMQEIITRREQLQEEIKAIRKSLKEYQPIISIYEEMKQYMIKAYLFDVYGKSEYVADFLKYKELARILEVSYNKSVEEVADFVADQRGQLAYAKTQVKELSAQYKDIYRFVNAGKFVDRQHVVSFMDAVGYKEAVRQAKDYKVYVNELRYITAANVDDVVIRVMTMAEIVDGKPIVVTNIEVLDKDENVVKTVSSKDMDNAAFNKELIALADEYGLKECSIHKTKIHKKSL
ncbi:MAG: relaxase/mobilization nuclease domain-containing protein [Clostridiales bacterium]|nr:relaxase/mobilization nuclease domain-containing protein [Clostridiales bacterium]